ncbi:elongation factor P--(R)-beta-lysine ligase [Paraferrimonas sedimenticola]|uniref:Elongation factor P--(R)-beta-lysine ligase n=1 Tax=Paraferrimonas sedimenticola TaxID=375674 RepID=A0AA37RXH2_9GAMM|nr:elongation factor P--(R)-beta-lysine ligase [Paraferrimonas sedimenticola]GLP97281.1 elongation factor P--(R)-beta-lysine ligase [Paraferrimonas sedimenticola]
MSQWQPSIDIDTLKARAQFIASIRQFFAERDVLEVETPALAHAGVTDLHLQNFETELAAPGQDSGRCLYLQTSPEYHMKRLLCAGAPAIYQISKAFRNEEWGRFHNPEFTMLEWYRPRFDHWQLMDEVDALAQHTLGCRPALKSSYQALFIEHTGLDPLSASDQALRQRSEGLGMSDAVANSDRDTLLQLLFSFVVEPSIGLEQPQLVYDFPASQAALAKLNPKDSRVAERFELYYRGVELANGFHELQDADEQAKRFEKDNQLRVQAGLPAKPVDQHLLSALAHGLPHCAGVALGVDRLFMIARGLTHIEQSIAFAAERA